MIKFKSLTTSKEFLGILKKKKLSTKYFTIYFGTNLQNIQQYLNIRFVMKKTFGKAIKRNKIKRKLKSAVQQILHKKRQIDFDYTYVIFGKNNVYKDEFVNVLNEMSVIFKKIKQLNGQPNEVNKLFFNTPNKNL